MKKLAIAATLAVLMGGFSSLYAQSGSDAWFMGNHYWPNIGQARQSYQKQIERDALINRATQDKNKVNLTYEKVWQYYTTSSTYSPSITGAYTTGTTESPTRSSSKTPSGCLS
jgi:hypothetical protein